MVTSPAVQSRGTGLPLKMKGLTKLSFHEIWAKDFRVRDTWNNHIKKTWYKDVKEV